MSAWADLVAVAVQGTTRRPPDPAAWLADLGTDAASLGGEPPDQVLDAAALLTAAQRAGAPVEAVPLDPTRPLVEPARPETGTMRADLARWWTTLHALDRALLGELLHGMRERGLVLPPWLAPQLLDLAGHPSATTRVRRDALAVAGQRGAWLAGQDERWRTLAAILSAAGPPGSSAPAVESSGAAPAAGEPGTDEPADTDRAWRQGDTGSRMAWLAALARTRPEAAREVAATALSGKGESADLRERVVTLLGELPLPGDDQLLERALDDRAVGVRRAAARVLGTRTGTAFQARMTARALAWVVPARASGFLARGHTLHVDPPAALEPDAERDQVHTEWQPFGVVRGERAQHLHAVVAATPLAAWAAYGNAEQLLRMPATQQWATVLHQGWARRTLTEGDRAWADGFLRVEPALPGVELLLPLASPEVQARAVVAGLAGAIAPERLPYWLDQLPHPWPAPVLAAFAEAIPRLAAGYPGQFTTLLAEFARTEPPPTAAVLAAAAAPLTGAWATVLGRTVDTLRLRAQLHAALDTPGPASPASPSPDPTSQGDQP